MGVVLGDTTTGEEERRDMRLYQRGGAEPMGRWTDVPRVVMLLHVARCGRHLFYRLDMGRHGGFYFWSLPPPPDACFR